MIEKYDLNPYKYDDIPTIFFGLYNIMDYKEFELHRGKAIIIWCGTDVLKIEKFKEFIPKIKTVTNIAISKFISDDLKKLNIRHKLIPITPTKNIKNLKPKGENIFFYGGLDNKFYGGDIVERIKNKIPYKIIIAKHNTYTKEELELIYESCFLGLRLTKHDGLPNTVCELGLMGRMCLYNGDLPNSISYINDDDIIQKIKLEYQNRNKDNTEIVDKMYDFLNIDNNWLHY